MRHAVLTLSRPLAAFVAAALLLLPAAAAGARAQDASAPTTIVVLGDSLSAGYELPAAAAFPAALERALAARGHAVRVVNAGVSGDTAAGGLARVDWSVPDGTDGVILQLGANDMLRGLDPAATERTLDAIVTRLQGRGVPVLLAGMYAARNLGPDYVAAFDAIYPRLAERHGLVYHPFFLEGALGAPGMMLPDGIHPNAQGVEAMVAAILPAVETFLGRLRGS